MVYNYKSAVRALKRKERRHDSMPSFLCVDICFEVGICSGKGSFWWNSLVGDATVRSVCDVTDKFEQVTRLGLEGKRRPSLSALFEVGI